MRARRACTEQCHRNEGSASCKARIVSLGQGELLVKKSEVAPNAGDGLFFNREAPAGKGDVLCAYGGVLVGAPARAGTCGCYELATEKGKSTGAKAHIFRFSFLIGFILLGSGTDAYNCGSRARYINYSKSRPNVEAKLTTDSSGEPSAVIIALEEIPRDRELLWDYGDPYASIVRHGLSHYLA